MPQPRLSEALMKEAADAYRAANNDITAAAVAVGVNRETLRYRVYKAAAAGMLGTDPVLPGFAIRRIGVQLDAEGNPQRKWIEQRPEAGEEFTVPDGHSIKGVSALVDASGRTIQQWVKTKDDGWSFDDLRSALREALAEFAGQAPYTPPPETTDADLVSVYPLADFHLGLLAWRKETGENWDLNIAQAAIGDALRRLIIGSPSSKQAVLLGLGDLVHADGLKNATPQSGNALDVDGRYPRVLQTTARLLVAATMQALAKHDQVLIRLIPGNHDPETAIALTLALGMYFQNEPRVTVDDDAGLFWWWEWGDVLLGAAHGDKARMDDLPLIMAARNHAAWGRTKYRLILTGHIHKQTAIEKLGVTVESFRSPTAPDAWTHGMGYGAGRTLTSIILHKTRGEIARQRVNIV